MIVEPGVIVFFILGLLIIVDCWVIYIACACTDRLESHLPNSEFVSSNRRNFASAGLVGKALRNGVLVIVLVFPAAFAKKGLCDLAEVRAFPEKDKILLLVSWGMMFALMLAMVFFQLWMKYRGLFG